MPRFSLIILLFQLAARAQDVHYPVLETTMDNKGNTYVLASFRDTLLIGTTTLISKDVLHGSHYLAKYNSAGYNEWVANLGSVYYNSYKNLCVTKDGSVYLSKNNRYQPIQLSKFSEEGKLCWTKIFGGSAYDKCFTLQLDKEENLLMTGSVWYSGTFGTECITFDKGICFFRAKLNPEGECLFVEKMN